jgi:hypothetical protein
MRLADSDDFGAGWRVFLSHTSELRNYPKGTSYVAAVERAISASGHVIVDMADFPAADQAPAQLCIDRVRRCDVYVGVLGTRYGSPVRDKPEVSYTELEFDTATEAGLDRLVFLLDTHAEDVGIPPSALIDREFGARQDAFRRRVQDSGLVAGSFASPARLEQLVERSLRDLADTRRRLGSGREREQVGGNVITGDVFVGRFARLRDKWLDPAPVFDEVQVERFTGREWLLEPVDRFLAAQDHGYVIVQADAGLGKTTLAAWLALSRGWPSHFTRRRKGRVALTALSNLAVQLIARYQLDEQFAPRGILPEMVGEPGWFDQVLRAAAEVASASGRQVVIVVDGLDEAEAVEGDPPLGLPAVLPRGAFIVATCRTGTNLPALRRPWKMFSIEPWDRRNTADLERFLHASFTEDQKLASLLSDAGITVEAITTRALDRCGGVWVYLRYVLEELRLGLRSVDEIDELPADLAGYYAESLMSGHYDPDWGRSKLPLLATLAAAAEPLSVTALTRLAGLPDPHPVRVLCGNRLRPFLTVTTGETGEQRYSVYHASLREFLAGRSPATLADGSQVQREELASATVNAHSQIADHYFTTFGGLQSGLPLLAANPAVAQQDDGYALRHLGEHLERAGRPDDLDILLACAHPAASAHGSVWFAAHEEAGTLGDYRADIDRARRRAAASTDHDVELGRTAPRFGQELRYLIIDSAVRTLTTNVPSALIARLVASGLWTPARGLFYARQPSDLSDRAAALATLVSHLPDHDRPAVTREAIATASGVATAYGRAWAFSTLLDELPEPHPDRLAIDALTATAEIMTDDDKAECLSWLVDYLPESLFPEAISISVAIHDQYQRTRALTELIPRLPATLLPAVLAAVSDIDDGADRSQVIVALAAQAPADMIPEIVTAARAIPTDDDRAWALGIAAAHMSALGPDLVSEALASAQAETDPANRAWALSSLAEHFSDAARQELLEEALSAARSADKDAVWALVMVAQKFPPRRRRSLLAEALRTTLSFPPGPEQTDSLIGLAQHLPKQLAAKAVPAALAIQSEPDRARVLTAYAPHLPDQLVEPFLKAAVEMREETHRGSVIRALVPSLPDHLIADALSAATTFSNAAERNRLIAVLADRLPDRLLSQALSLVQSLTNGAGSAQFLRALAIRMEPPQDTRLLLEALDAARSVTDEQERAQVLGDIAASLNEPERGAILDEAIQSALADPYDFARVYALDYLIPVLTARQRKQAISEALKITRAMADLEDRAIWLADLTRRLPRSERKALLTEALETARMVPSERQKLLVIAVIAASAPDEQTTEVLDEFRSLSRAATKDMSIMVRTLIRMTRVLPDRVIIRTLRLVRQAMYQDSPLTTAARILQYIPNAILNEVLDAVRNYPPGFRGSHALGAVSLYMPSQLRQNALDLALTSHPVVVARRAIMAQAQSLWRESITVAELDIFRQVISGIGFDECLNVLSSALEIVTQIAGPQVLDDCLEAFRTVQRWWPPPEAAS